MKALSVNRNVRTTGSVQKLQQGKCHVKHEGLSVPASCHKLGLKRILNQNDIKLGHKMDGYQINMEDNAIVSCYQNTRCTAMRETQQITATPSLT